MTTPFSITITLTKTEAGIAIAEYIQKKLGAEFSVKADKVNFEITQIYAGNEFCSASEHEFTKVTAEATKS